MGLLDGILTSLCGGGAPPGQSSLGAVLNDLGAGNQARSTSLLTVAMSLLQQHGGISGVLEKFRQNGMAQHVESWVGNGPNLAISSEQVQQVFGSSSIGNAAAQLGQSHGQTTAALAQIVPELVNHLTPQGHVPSNIEEVLSKTLTSLRGAPAA